MRSTLILVLLWTVPARADYLEQLRKNAAEQAAEELVELAKWCQSKGNNASRNRIWNFILELDPDHAWARRKLRYVRRHSEWVQRGVPPAAKDRDAGALDELDRRRRAIGGHYAEHVVPHLERSWRTAAPATRARVYRELFALAPDHVRAHHARGEVRVKKRWVLRETPRGATRRIVMAQLLKEAFGEVPSPILSKPTDAERALGVKWHSALKGQDWRLVTAAPAFEALRGIRVADASRLLIESTLGRDSKRAPPALRLLMVATRPEYETVLKAHPHTDEKSYKFDSAVSSCWLPKSNTCLMFDATVNQRFEGSARQPVGYHLWSYFGLTGRHGWAWEGFGLYFTYQLTGYRLSYYVRQTRYAKDAAGLAAKTRGIDAKMRKPAANWFKLSADLDAPDWKLLLSKDVNQMDSVDLLWSYLLAAFVLEAYPDKANALLTRIGKGAASADALVAELELPLDDLALRVRRYAKER